MDLPRFKYHPNPLKTGSIEASKGKCRCCGQARGYIYTGPVYAVEELAEALCPWCIADGKAHEKFDAMFTDDAGIGGGGEWGEVPAEVMEEVAYRTPGFSGIQQEKWWVHCSDAAEFLGCAGKEELLALGEQAMEAIRKDSGLEKGEPWDEFLESLDKDGAPCAYIFRCRKCGLYGGYQDTD